MDNLKKNIRFYLVGILLIVNIFIWSVISEQESNQLIVAFLDVGQGDSIFIEAPNGNQILIDAGSNKSVLRQLSKVMPFYDRSIDIVLATHPDKDHIGGIPDILQRYKIDLILESGNTSDSGTFKELLRLIELNNIKQIEAKRGMVVVLDNDVHLRILFPDRDVVDLESNTASIIAQLIYKDVEFMLTGDSPKAIEEYLVMLDGEGLQSDVLKAGHHGSKTSSSLAFLDYVSPKYAIISAGKDNSYGHPHKEVVDSLKQFGASISSTQDKGMIVFETDGKNLIVK